MGWHIELIAAKLVALCGGRIRRLIVNLPPRHLKSLLGSLAFPAWCLGHEPSAQILCVSYAQDLADKLSRDCRHIVASGWYRQVFPGTRLSPQCAAMPEFDTTAQGCRLATSVGGVLTGRGDGLIIIDDPLKPQPASLSLYWADQLDFSAGPASRSVDRARRAPSGSCAMTLRYARAG